jgi:glycosyltransferase involved in cell wall biosynthesis
LDAVPRPEFTVAVPTRDRRESLSRTLDSLAEQQARASWEVVVVDNGSADGTLEWLHERRTRFPVPLRIESEKSPGASLARNLAIASARGRVVLFTDDDVTCRPGWLQAHVAAFADPSVVGTGGRILPELPPEAPEWLRRALPAEQGGPTARYDFGTQPAEILAGRPLLPAFSANMGVVRECARAVGGFRTDLGPGCKIPIGDDTEFFERILDLPGRCLYVPDAAVDHHVFPVRTTRGYYLRWHVNLGRASIAMRRPLGVTERIGALLRYGLRFAIWAGRARRRRGDPHLELHGLRRRETARGRCLELLGR